MYVAEIAAMCCSNGISACDAAPTPCEEDADFEHNRVTQVNCVKHGATQESCTSAGGLVEDDDCLMTPTECTAFGGQVAKIWETCGTRAALYWAPMMRNGMPCDGTVDASQCPADSENPERG